MIVPFILLSLAAYVLGSVPASVLAVRWLRKMDIRKVGTGKVGASNVLRMAGKRLAIPVAIFDVGKGMLSVWAAREMGLNTWQQASVGMMAVVGHNWPVFLSFRGGGRGVLASLGVITMLSWKLGIIAVVIAYSLAPWHQVALGVLIGYAALPFLSWFLAEPLDIEERAPVTAAMVAILVMGLMKRLIARRPAVSKDISWREILLNRLLFDRDIGDRRLWVTTGSTKKG